MLRTLPVGSRAACEELARISARVLKEYGALCVVSFVEWPDKATRDAGMEKVTRDPRIQFHDRPAVFDGQRLIAAGFKPMLREDNEG